MGTKATVPAVPEDRPLRRRSGGLRSASVIAIANCALAGVMTVFVTTQSVEVTLIAAVTAVCLVAVAALRG